MSVEQWAPAAIAAGGGTALATAIYVHERLQDEAMRSSRTPSSMRFPVGLEREAALSALAGLSGLADRFELIVETIATEEGVAFGCALPQAAQDAATAALASAMPGLRLRDQAPLAGRVTLALRLFVPTPIVLRIDDPEASSRALLTGLSRLNAGEQVVIRWALRPGRPRPWHSSVDRPDADARQVERSWRTKTTAPGFFAEGLVLVRAGGIARARELIDHVAGVVRSRRSLGRPLQSTAERGSRSLAALPRVRRSSGWLSTTELLALLAWPLGPEPVPGVELGAARELLVPRHVGREGRPLFIGQDNRGDRPVALSPEGARHHVAIVGPTGVGKSVLLARSILSDLERGFGGAVIDPKADLLQTVLEHVPAEHVDRVVVLDPAERVVPGINVLGTGDPDLRTDVLIGALRGLFDSFGIRSDLYLRMAFRTLSDVPGATLTDVSRLFFDAGFRRSAVSRVRDPFLRSSWQAYESLSVGEQAQHVQAPMARIMALLGRPAVRAVLAQPEPKLDIAQLFRERRWLMVSLAPGVLGEPAARLVGAVVAYVIWSAVEARVAIPPEKRHPLFIYVDELATLSNLPFGFELLAERARGLGAGLTVALQTFERLPAATVSALLGNAATLVSFRAAAREAVPLARELPGLTSRDLQALDPYHVAARVSTGRGSGVATVTGHTEPLGEPTGQAEIIRARSAARYGMDRTALEANAERPAEAGDDSTPIGRRRRRS